jgi:hypothetical protein
MHNVPIKHVIVCWIGEWGLLAYRMQMSACSVIVALLWQHLSVRAH